MHKSAPKCNETLGKWCKNKHGASKIIDALETYQSCAWQAQISASPSSASTPMTTLTTSPTILLVYSVQAKPQYAYAPDVRLVLAQLWPHLILDDSDCINFGIIILNDCPRCVPVIITMVPSSCLRLQVRLHQHW
jgi:hypothetical protein